MDLKCAHLDIEGSVESIQEGFESLDFNIHECRDWVSRDFAMRILSSLLLHQKAETSRAGSSPPFSLILHCGGYLYKARDVAPRDKGGK